MMNRQQILGSSPEAPWTDIEIPEWGGTYLLRPLRGDQVEEIGLLSVQARQSGNLLCLRGLSGRVTAWTVCTQDRKPVFQPSDAASLTEQHLDVCNRVHARVMTANRIDDDKAAIEDAEKNSVSIQTSGSGCTLPEQSPEAPSKSASSE